MENNDKRKVAIRLKEYIKIISREYSGKINNDILCYLNNSDNLVEFNTSNTISFIVRNGKLLLPRIAYYVFDALKKEPNYGTNKNDKRSVSEYLDTNTTYLEYIDHAIVAGLDTIDYFEESLLHEAMHLCGSGGGDPLQEGINELKTRELAQKYNLKISGYGYPKEVEVAKMFQEIIGKENMDVLTFLNHQERLSFLNNSVGKDVATLYNQVSLEMLKSCRNYNVLIDKISSPIEKASLYDSIDYFSSHSLIESYKERNDTNYSK